MFSLPMLWTVRHSAFVASLTLLVPVAVPAAPVPADTVEVRAEETVREARAAQARFERVRHRHLPWARSGPSGECDERIGRFCFWHEDDGEAWEPPPEPPPVTRAREDLLEALADAARVLPDHGWIAGQRIRYLVEAERLDEALAVGRTCRAERWWCRALVGYVHHAARRFPEAEAAFDAALAAMDPVRRASWSDLTPVLEGEGRLAWKGLGTGGREALARRFWWLADPLWVVSGNERRSEHFARRVVDRMQEDARSGFDVPWDTDLEEIVLRYGWPSGWERVRAGAHALARPEAVSIVGHDPPGGRRFAPPFATLLAPSARLPGDWTRAERPRSTYAVPYAGRFDELPHQLAVFRRGDSARVVAGWEMDRDSIPEGIVIEAALVVATGPDDEPAVDRRRVSAATGALDVVVPWGPAVVSVEAVAREAPRAGRARYGLPVSGPPGARPAVSDLLLLRVGDENLPPTLDAAVERVRGSLVVEPGETVGLFWEIYPPGGGTREATVSVGLMDERGGFWRGVGRALGFGDDPAEGVGMAWTERVGDADRHPRAVAVTLPRDLPGGEYAIELEITLPDSRVVRARRDIVVGR